MKQAFTLIELLVVIAIIGLLSTIAVVSLSASRVKARDAKRMADLRQISQAIELFADVNSYLPRNSAGWCTFISNPAGGLGAGFQSDIVSFLARTPLDPTQHNQIGDYLYQNIDNKTRYILCANMEKATGNAYDYSGCSGGAVYNYCISPNGT